MLELRPTLEQEAIVHAAVSLRASLMVNAYAGCAKSKTLEMLSWKISERNVLAVAFNVKNKQELENSLPSFIKVRTLNGLGHGAWGKAIGKNLTLEDGKLGKTISRLAKDRNLGLDTEDWSGVLALVKLARNRGLVPSAFPHKGLVPDTPTTWESLAFEVFTDDSLSEFSREVLIDSIKQGFQGIIDFDDQIYLSAMFNGVFPRVPLVLVDEYQDLNVLNIIQIKRSSSDRLIVVGDERQSIYQFRGANENARSDFKKLKTEWVDLPLTTTFRCPKSIVRRQQSHAPGFNAFETNKPGRIVSFVNTTPNKKLWTWAYVERLKPNPQATVTVLCRNNAPILAMALKLVRKGIGCQILGGSLGKGLISLAKKIIKDHNSRLPDCEVLIKNWRDIETAKALEKDRQERISGINDRADCLLAVLHDGFIENAKDLFSTLEEIFSKESSHLTLSTIHRFKGMEADVILHLDPHRIPSKWAKEAFNAGDPRLLEQEKNLLYVCETRTRNVFIEAKLEDFE